MVFFGVESSGLVAATDRGLLWQGRVCIRHKARLQEQLVCGPSASVSSALAVCAWHLLTCFPDLHAGLPVLETSGRRPSVAQAIETYGCQDQEGDYRGPQAGGCEAGRREKGERGIARKSQWSCWVYHRSTYSWLGLSSCVVGVCSCVVAVCS